MEKSCKEIVEAGDLTPFKCFGGKDNDVSIWRSRPNLHITIACYTIQKW